MSDIHAYNNKVLSLIAQDRLEEAIEMLQPMVQGSDLLYDLLIQSARYAHISQAIRRGTVNVEQSDLRQNQIRQALIEIVLRLEEGTADDPTLRQELETHLQAQQQHTGSGDNIGRDKHSTTVHNDGAKIGQQNIDSEVDNRGANFTVS